MERPVAELWYGIEPYPGDVVRLREVHIHPYWSGSIWLVRGRDRDVVVETGTGMVPPGPVVAAITDRPVLAVALSHYYDHAGGLSSFDERACHVLEADLLAHPPRTWGNFVKADPFSALPRAGFTVQDYAMASAPPTVTLEDGDSIDLGNRRLTVLHVPGRSPGSIALWEEATGYLFGGETLFLDPDGYDFPPQTVDLYEDSLRRLNDLPVETVFGGHYGSFSAAELGRLVESEIGRYPPSAEAP